MSSITQFNPFEALAQGFYDGVTTIGELKRHGDFGMGAMNAIDGEMVAIDGAFYQIGISGTLTEVTHDHRLPWAMVTRFEPTGDVLHLQAGLELPGLTEVLSGLKRLNNLFLAFRIDGVASKVKARSLPRQKKPYLPLKQLQPTFSFYELIDVPIAGIGFLSPSYVGTLDPSSDGGAHAGGIHLHFVTTDRTCGGHVQELTLREGTLRVSPIHQFQMHCPQDFEFYGAPSPSIAPP